MGLAPDASQLTGFLAAAGVSQMDVGFRLYVDSFVAFSTQMPLVSHGNFFFLSSNRLKRAGCSF